MLLMPILHSVLAVAVVPAPRAIQLHEGAVATGAVQVVETRDEGVPAEGYRLEVSPSGVSVSASGAAGFFYARKTLAQLAEGGRWPCCRIEDAPAFRWRGVMLDEGRHFFGKETVKGLLDQMACHKLNVFHWHLTEDQGWHRRRY